MNAALGVRFVFFTAFDVLGIGGFMCLLWLGKAIKTAVQLLPTKVPVERIRQVAKAILKVKGGGRRSNQFHLLLV
jgi:hypothetical protein